MFFSIIIFSNLVMYEVLVVTKGLEYCFEIYTYLINHILLIV